MDSVLRLQVEVLQSHESLYARAEYIAHLRVKFTGAKSPSRSVWLIRVRVLYDTVPSQVLDQDMVCPLLVIMMFSIVCYVRDLE